MELASKYDPKEVESKWYQYWLDNKLFASKPDGAQCDRCVAYGPHVEQHHSGYLGASCPYGG